MGAEIEQELHELMIKSLNGDNQAYELILSKIHRYIFPFVRSKVSSASDAEDIVQEILITVHKVKNTYDTARPFTPWLFAIANFKIIDLFRKNGKDRKKEEMYFDFQALNMPDDSIAKENEGLNQAIEGLNPREIELLRLSKVDGYSLKEISEQLTLSLSSVKVALHRAYKKLKLAHDN